MALPSFDILTRPITTDEDADQALRLLGWIAARESELKSRLKQKTAEATEAMKQQCQVEVEGVTFWFSEVVPALQQALTAYVDSERDRLFQDKKTYALTHGELRLRKQADRLVLAEGETEESVLSRISHDDRLIRRKTEIDLQSIRTLHSKGILSDADLASWGLRFEAGGDEIQLKPREG